MKAQKTIHNIGAFLSKQTDQNVDVSVVLSLEETSHSQSPVDTNISSQTSSQIVKPNPFILNEHTAVAELIWTLKCVYSRFSYNSCKDVGSLFKVGCSTQSVNCTLSHGNASVERGFSVNESILVENMSERSLIGQRLVIDAIN